MLLPTSRRAVGSSSVGIEFTYCYYPDKNKRARNGGGLAVAAVSRLARAGKVAFFTCPSEPNDTNCEITLAYNISAGATNVAYDTRDASGRPRRRRRVVRHDENVRGNDVSLS